MASSNKTKTLYSMSLLSFIFLVFAPGFLPLQFCPFYQHHHFRSCTQRSNELHKEYENERPRQDTGGKKSTSIKVVLCRELSPMGTAKIVEVFYK